MENISNITVRNIISPDINGYSRVTVSNELFNAVRGVKPTLAYKGMGDVGGNGVRVFTLNNIDLYVHYDKENRNTMFIMKTSDALKCLKPLSVERANEVKLPFNSTMFAAPATA